MSNKEQQSSQTEKAPSAQAIDHVNGPGKQLVKARDAMGLTQQDVANRLHLRIVSVQAVESDALEEGVSLTFTKGYVRLYAKLVNMDAEPLLLAYDKLHIKESQPAKLQSFSRRVSREAHDHRWNMVSVVVVLLVLGSVVVWWVEREGYFKDSGNNISEAFDNIISSEDEEEQDVQIDLTALTEDNLVKQDAGPQILEEDVVALETKGELANNGNAIVNVDQNDQSFAAGSAQDAPEGISTEAEQTASDAAAADLTGDAEPETNVNEGGRQVDPSRGDIVEGVFTDEGYRLNADGTVDVAFTFLEDCWVSVKDGNGGTMAYGVKTKGRVMTVSGVPPVTVILGAPSAVAIDFGGFQVDMGVYPGGESARFSLPIEGE